MAKVLEWVDGQKVIRDALPDEFPIQTPEQVAESLPTISMAQLLSGLVEREMITMAEGEAWLAGNAMPEDVLTFIGTLPANVRFRAKAKALRMTSAARLDPIVTGLGTLRNMDAAALNEFWRYCMEIQDGTPE